jgi:hypothetical protein
LQNLKEKKRNLSAFTANGFNSEELESDWKVHEKHKIVTWNLETISVNCLKAEKNHESLCQDGWLQDLPDGF